MLIKRGLLIIGLWIVTVSTQAETFYVSSLSGNDANDGLSPNTAWQSIAKLNEVIFEDGGTILFRRGEVFRGQLSPLKFPKGLTFSAYGEGDNPVISGSVLITNWQPSSLGQGIFEADTSHLPLHEADIQHLFINGELMTIARYPNVDAPNEKNWLETGDASLNAGKNSFIDPALTAYNKPDDYWTGALVRIRNYSWTYMVVEISRYNAAQGKVTTKPEQNFELGSQLPGWGYFIEGKLEELDHPGEWFYDATQQKIYLKPRHNLDPNTALVEGMTYAVGISMSSGEDETTIENLTFRHFTERGVKLGGSRHITVQQCHFEHNMVGVYTWNVANVRIVNNTFDKQLKDDIGLQAASDFDVEESVIENNLLTNTAMYPAYGRRYPGVYQGQGISAFGSHYKIRRNHIENTCHAGIYLKDGGHHVVENNVIRNTLQLLNDGGAIAIGSDGNVIRGNFLLDTWGNVDESNGWGSETGMHHPTYGMGIGADNNYKDNTIEDNIVANNQDMGIRLNAFKNTIVRNNLVYNNDPQIVVEDKKGPSNNNLIENNIAYSLDSAQVGLSMTGSKEHGQSDNNFFCNPYNTLMGIRDKVYYGLAHWQNQFSLLDQNSRFCAFIRKAYLTVEQGDNLITNAIFDNDVSGWKGNIIHDPSKDGMDGGSLKFTGDANKNSLTHSGFTLQAGQFYRLRFSVLGNGFGSLQMRINDINPDDRTILEDQHYPYDETRHDYEFTFQATRTTAQGQLIFITRQQDEKIYWIDNVSLYPVDAQVIAKTEQSKLFMNPTDQTQQITLPAGVAFSNLQGQSVSGQITLPPYSAEILIRSDEAIPPASPYLTLMQNGRRVTATWAPVIGATGYRLYYAEYPNAPQIFNLDMGTQNRLSVDLQKNAAFYVAVGAYNPFGESDYSNIRYFILKQ